MPQIALTGGAPAPITQDFPFQSYFDTALMQKALLPQTTSIVGPGAPNMPGTPPLTVQTGGLAVQLHPSSMTPIAIDFTLANGVPSSPVLMKPGQIIRPGRFSSFQWGLPFGWLGGGIATILLAQNELSDFGAPANAEVVFHRQRMQIIASTSVAVVPVPNWPIRFPWPGAISGAVGGTPQGQLPTGGVVNPTKIMARLRVSPVPAGGAVTRFILFNIDEFDRTQGYAVPNVLTGACAVDVQWQPFDQSGIAVTGGTPPLEYQVQELDLTTPIARLGGDNCCVVIVDVTPGGANPVAGSFIDVVRYGGL